MATFQMTDSQQSVFAIGYADKRGNPVPPPAGATPPAWLVDNPAMLALAPAADGMSCVVSAVGPLGTATVSVKVTDSAGSALAAGQVDVTITGGAPTTVVLTPESPSEQP